MPNVLPFPEPKVVGLLALGPTHLKALRFIEAYIATNGEWPTFVEIGEAVGTSSHHMAVRLVNQLFRANAISRPDYPHA